ncbi:regulator of G-protein signaling rgs-7-like [Symsagittifera roscoffensis]|uniref:regulator of G-protein signaling rgs-7-like n=1 Tax=Symsagittifera roscoffensis TaxID=84072 RepID=UPI00307BFE38
MAQNKAFGKWSALFDNEEFCSIFDLSDSSIDASADTPSLRAESKHPSRPLSERINSFTSEDSFNVSYAIEMYDPESKNETHDLSSSKLHFDDNFLDNESIKIHSFTIGKSDSSYSVHSENSKSEHASEEENCDDNGARDNHSSDKTSNHLDRPTSETQFTTPIKPISKTKLHESIRSTFSHVTKSLQKSVGKNRNFSVKTFHDQNSPVKSKSENSDWSSSLMATLNHNEGFRLFQKHLENELSTENLNFWLDCQKLKQLHGKMFVKRVIEMYGIYFSDDSPMELNVDIKIKLEVANSIIRKPNRKCFDRALDHVIKLMERDSFPRFQATLTDNKLFNQTSNEPF